MSQIVCFFEHNRLYYDLCHLFNDLQYFSLQNCYSDSHRNFEPQLTKWEKSVSILPLLPLSLKSI